MARRGLVQPTACRQSASGHSQSCALTEQCLRTDPTRKVRAGQALFVAKDSKAKLYSGLSSPALLGAWQPGREPLAQLPLALHHCRQLEAGRQRPASFAVRQIELQIRQSRVMDFVRGGGKFRKSLGCHISQIILHADGATLLDASDESRGEGRPPGL